MTVKEILQGIPALRILIAGDICLDRWCTYDPAHREPSRETGLDRIAVISTVVTPGGGGTVANNLAALGAKVLVLGVTGDDGFGFELARALTERNIDATHLIRSSALQTFTYTKLINSTNRVEDQPRIDFIHSEPPARRLGFPTDRQPQGTRPPLRRHHCLRPVRNGSFRSSDCRNAPTPLRAP